MGRHAAPEPESANEGRVSSWPPEPGQTESPQWANWTWIIVGVLAVAAVIIALLPGNSASSSGSPTSASSSTAPESYDRSQYTSPWWVDVKGEFAQRYQHYAPGDPHSPGAWAVGTDYCITLRAGDTSSVTDGTFDPATTWAILNTAIDTLCPDQEGYRNLIASP